MIVYNTRSPRHRRGLLQRVDKLDPAIPRSTPRVLDSQGEATWEPVLLFARENGFPRQCEHWLGMTGKRGGDSTVPSCSYAALSLPLFFFRLRMKGISRFLNRRSFAVTP